MIASTLQEYSIFSEQSAQTTAKAQDAGCASGKSSLAERSIVGSLIKSTPSNHDDYLYPMNKDNTHGNSC